MDGIQPLHFLFFRFLTGFFLAGIYPVGMKIASDYYQEGLGKSLGFLVGALVMGTAFPHLVKNFTLGFSWEYVVYATTFLSVIGGIGVFAFVPNGPYRRTGQKMNFRTFTKSFRSQGFRAVAFGYFGHMWELYTFWTFVPLMLNTHRSVYPENQLNVSMWSFFIIASGAVACVGSGLLSQHVGVKRTATLALSLSGLCCLLSPFFLFVPSSFLFVGFLVFWGIVVVADSPLFSTLVAQHAQKETRGTSLTIVNCIGFSITILSIQCLRFFMDKIDNHYLYLLLAIGPLAGLVALLKKKEGLLF
jgi:MFS family permease